MVRHAGKAPFPPRCSHLFFQKMESLFESSFLLIPGDGNVNLVLRLSVRVDLVLSLVDGCILCLHGTILIFFNITFHKF